MNLEELQTKLNIYFKNIELLETALTHRSVSQNNNERLEFLGDTVLELLVSKYLFKKFPNANEGILTRYRSSMVKAETLADVAQNKLSLGNYLKMSKGEEDSGGRNRKNLLADAMEALIGAIYIEKGLEYANNFLYTNLYSVLDKIIENESYVDNKSKLQEVCQLRYKTMPKYRIVKTEGPAHNRFFTAQAYINKKPFGTGQGQSKREAEENAAQYVLDNLDKYDQDQINKKG